MQGPGWGYNGGMGILDRLFGRQPRRYQYEDRGYERPAYGTPSGSPSYGMPPGSPAYGTPPGASYAPEPGASSDQAKRDEEAIRRYRYLLRTAPPDAVEQAHAEAFAQLSPDQRRQVLGQLANHVPEYEKVQDSDPRTLARMATRAEMRQPGFLERVFGGYGPGYGRGYGGGYGGGYGYGGGMMGGGMGMGGMIAGGLLASVAGSFIGTAIAEEMFDHDDYMASGFADPSGDGSDIAFDNNQVDTSGVDDRTLADGGYDDPNAGDPGDAGGSNDFGDLGDGGGDFGDFGDGGGDFGGGDW